LYTNNPLTTGLALDSPAWFIWLEAETTTSFYFQDGDFGMTVRRESRQRGSRYWLAYHFSQGKLHKVYLGTTPKVNRTSLEAGLTLLTVNSPQKPRG
jgi:LuxR family maltose regulon positive regulatory protein